MVRGAYQMRSMNTLTDAQRERVLALLREGKSLRSIENETGHRRETIAAYGRRAGLLDTTVRRLTPAAPCRDAQALAA
jgi:DNA-binding CsgD family transcriptional regulator